ncbi:hypothetical protein QCA50_004060 [Cerrena zonata]|uniref:Cytochrome P450 n=1 Tax=Cerrena zonata TaxID=2478898 RepID=A0AAW0GMW9_9APHY
MSYSLFPTLLAVLSVWLVLRLRKVGSRERDLPPGPPTLPLLGNLLEFPTSKIYIQFSKWAKSYGDIFSLKIGPTTVVVLSDPKIIRECLDVHGATTSSRPFFYVNELISNNCEIGFMEYGPTWRNLRRAAHDVLSAEACVKYIPIQRAEAFRLMYDLLERPQQFTTHIYRYAASVIFSVIYGIHCPEFENTFIREFYDVTAEFDKVLKPGFAPPVEWFPILRHIPERWAPWKRICKAIRTQQRKLFFTLLDLCEENMKNGTRNGCFMESVIDRQAEYSFDRELLGYFGAGILEGGTDTTSVYLQSFVGCVVANPAIQARAQAEIDHVIGSKRCPEPDDFEHLPYLQALVKEVHRYCPVTPLAVPHATIADERIGNYVIPKGSTIFMNTWAINRHEDYYDNPHIFDPERYMQSEFGTKPDVDTSAFRNDMIFGAGRRICPGKHLASTSITLNAMNLLWAFNFLPAKDLHTGEQKKIDLNDAEDFDCEIVPRSAEKADMIRAQFVVAKSTFELFDRRVPVTAS